MSIIKPLLKIAISLALIAIVLRAFDVKGVVAHVARVDVGTLLLALGIALSIALLHTARWLAVIDANGSRLGFRTALQVILIGHFFNQALPSSVGGDAVRVWCAYRAGLRFNDALNTVIMDRAFSLFSLLLLSALGVPWLFEMVGDPAARWALTTVLFAGLTGFGAFLALRGLPAVIARARVMRALLELSALGRRVMFGFRFASVTVLTSALSFIGFAVIVYLLANAMGLSIPLKACVLLVPPVVLVSVLPISIAGWGVREGAMVVAFGFIAVPASGAFAVSVMLGLTLAAASLPGALFWWMSGYSIRNIADDTTTLAANEPNQG